MKVENIVSARSLWFMDLRNLNPRGRNLYRVIVPALVEWYGFADPQQPYVESAGVQFTGGEFSSAHSEDGLDLTGVAATIYSNGLLAQTQTSTDDSDRFLDEALARLAKEGHVAFQSSFVKRRDYQSEIVIRTEGPLAFPQFSDFCATLSKLAYPNTAEPPFKTSGLVIDADADLPNRKRPQFTLERKVDAPWSENLYYSQAPLSTHQHIEALSELEKILIA